MSSRAEARALVEGIFEDHGYIPQEILEGLSESQRDAVEKALGKKDRMIASSVTTYDFAVNSTFFVLGYRR